MRSAMLITVLMACGIPTAAGQEPANRQTEDEAAIRKAVGAYVAAFNQADPKALAAMWSPEAVYINPESGEEVVGREAIEIQFGEIFATAKGTQLEAQTNAIQFVSPNVARTGLREARDGPATRRIRTRQSIQADGHVVDASRRRMCLSCVSHEQLKELEWMIGTWVDQDEESRIETTCQWTKNQNFIVRWFTVSVRDRINMAGVQIVGWDPAAKQIRSWVFDSDGGFGEGTWTNRNQCWYIQAKGTLPDGTKTSAVNIVTYVDNSTFTWQSINREVGGEILPNVDEVVVARQQDGE